MFAATSFFTRCWFFLCHGKDVFTGSRFGQPGTLSFADAAETMELLCLVLGVWVLWLVWAIQTWWLHFSKRLPRSDPSSPSRGPRPKLGQKPSAPHFGSALPALPVAAPETPETFTLPGATHGANDTEQDHTMGQAFRSRALGSQRMKTAPALPLEKKRCPVLLGSSPLGKSLQSCPVGPVGSSVPVPLDMNHVSLGLWQYLWAAHAIAIPAIALVMLGWCQIQLSRLLKLLGLLPEASEIDLRRMIYHLVLENLCTGVADIEGTEAGKVATFVFSPFPLYLDQKSQVLSHVKTSMVVKLNLSREDFVHAELDGDICSLTDAAVLLAHYVTNVNHPRMHAYANWAIDPADRSNRYLQKMSVVTTCYNHYGLTNFPQMASNMVHQGAGPAVAACFKESLRSGVPEHKQVLALGEHSKLLNFMIKLRLPFKQAFRECREDFPASYSCESHFLGTVVHSLDHYVFCKTINPWVFSGLKPSKEYQTLHSTVLLARCCALDDIPTVGLEKYFKDTWPCLLYDFSLSQ